MRVVPEDQLIAMKMLPKFDKSLYKLENIINRFRADKLPIFKALHQIVETTGQMLEDYEKSGGTIVKK